MPKETFYHLNAQKKERIEKALEKEFSRTSFEKASISKIIEEADIPRGSFYQYFEDKEDAIQYMVEKYMLIEKETIENILKETEGNIFEASLKIFDVITDKNNTSVEKNFYYNLMLEFKKNNVNFFQYWEEHTRMEELNQWIEVSILNIKEPKEVRHILKIMTAIIRMNSINVNNGTRTITEARKELVEQINILRRGIEK